MTSVVEPDAPGKAGATAGGVINADASTVLFREIDTAGGQRFGIATLNAPASLNSGDQAGAPQIAQRIAFIGLGNMGGPMALNLHRAGHHVSAFDLSANACDHWQAQGLNIAASAVASIEDADIVITMLPASRHVEALYLGGADVEGLLDKIDGQALVIDCSTIATASAKKVAAAAADGGIAMLDAPVSGGTAGAAAGTLTFMVGGSDHSLARARPLLDVMGANIFHAGAAGAGQTAKICNNMLLGILMIGTSEALALGMANGLDPKALSEIMRLSSGGNWALEKYNPVPDVQPNAPASRDYSGGFGTDLMLKDLGLAMESALGTGNATPLGSMARNLYALHSGSGHGGLDFSSIVQLFGVYEQGSTSTVCSKRSATSCGKAKAD